MTRQDLLASGQDHTAREEALAPMRALTAEELLEVVGGPEIQNGGSSTSVASSDSTGT